MYLVFSFLCFGRVEGDCNSKSPCKSCFAATYLLLYHHELHCYSYSQLHMDLNYLGRDKPYGQKAKKLRWPRCSRYQIAKNKSRGSHFSCSSPPNNSVKQTKLRSQNDASHHHLFHHHSSLSCRDLSLPYPFTQTWIIPIRHSPPQHIPLNDGIAGTTVASAGTEQSIAAPVPRFMPVYIPQGSTPMLLKAFWGEFLNPAASFKAISGKKRQQESWICNTLMKKSCAVFCSIAAKCWNLQSEAGMGLLRSRKKSVICYDYMPVFVLMCTCVCLYL